MIYNPYISLFLHWKRATNYLEGGSLEFFRKGSDSGILFFK